MKDYVGPGALLELLWDGIRLRPSRYREVAADAAALRLCLAVAVLAGAATGLGRGAEIGLAPVVSVLVYILITLTTVVVEAAALWTLARVGLRSGTAFGAVVRPLALATAPRLIYVLLAAGTGVRAVEVAATLWLLGAFVLGVEAVLRRGWPLAVAVTCVIGVLRWLAYAGVQAL